MFNNTLAQCCVSKKNTEKRNTVIEMNKNRDKGNWKDKNMPLRVALFKLFLGFLFFSLHFFIPSSFNMGFLD